MDSVAALRAHVEELSAQLAQFTAQLATATQERDQASKERDQYHALYLATLEQCRKLELGLWGSKAERLSANESQLTMAILEAVIGRPLDAPEETAPDETSGADDDDDDKKRPRPKPTGRRPLPSKLPRVEITLLPPEVERDGLEAFERIGEEVSETVEQRRASLVVVRIVRPKFVRKDRERNAETDVHKAEPPELPIERGLAGPGLLADTIVRRWWDSLPLNRLESIYAREGLELDRSTMCTWHKQLSLLVAPLVLAMWRDALASPYLCTDSTGVLVQAKEKCRTGHFWVVVAPERHVLYAYSPKNDSAAVDKLLGNYKGYLVADALNVYDHLFASGDVVECGCWAHARRYFFKALASDPERARFALGLIKALFALEKTIAGEPPGKRRSVRARESAPLVDRFFAWCDQQAPHVLDDTPIQKAVTYATNQRAALRRFLDDDRLPIHNNISEQALRREVVGRKNWLFVGNDQAGGTNAAFVTLLASCRLHGIEPWSYLRDLLCLLPAWPKSRVLELAPAYWKQTQQQEEATKRLEEHVFRGVTAVPVSSHPDNK